MSSYGDIQLTYQTLQRILELLQQISTEAETDMSKIKDLTVNAVLAERLLNEILVTTRKISGDETLDKHISNVQRAIFLVNTLRIISAMLVAQNPWMVAIGVASLIGTAYSIPDMIGSYG